VPIGVRGEKPDGRESSDDATLPKSLYQIGAVVTAVLSVNSGGDEDVGFFYRLAWHVTSTLSATDKQCKPALRFLKPVRRHCKSMKV